MCPNSSRNFREGLRNVKAGKTPLAKSLLDVIGDHKRRWIDQVISTRDALIHLPDGAHQLMFELKLENHNGNLVLSEVVPPSIGGVTIAEYAGERLLTMKQFARDFLATLQTSADAEPARG